MLLCLRAKAGGSIPELSALRREAREWIEAIDSLLPDLSLLSPGEAIELLEPRDFIHRLAFNAPPLPDFGDEIILRAFRAKIKGDPGVDIFTLHRALDVPILRRVKEFLGAPLRWHAARLERWYHNNLECRILNLEEAHNSKFNIPNSKLEEAALLLRADLYDFTPDQQSYKRRLVAHLLPALKEQLLGHEDQLSGQEEQLLRGQEPPVPGASESAQPLLSMFPACGEEKTNVSGASEADSPLSPLFPACGKASILREAKTIIRLLFAARPHLPLTDYDRLMRRAEALLATSLREKTAPIAPAVCASAASLRRAEYIQNHLS